MWPFTSRSSRSDTTASEPDNLPNFDDFIQSDETIKVWMPEHLVEKLNWLSLQFDVSKPDAVRALLFEHLYGRVAYEALSFYAANKNRESSIAKISRQAMGRTEGRVDMALHGIGFPTVEKIQYSARIGTTIDIQHIGVSNWDFKFQLPRKMKVDLSQVAATYKLTPSQYVRKMLVLQLMGEQAHGAWQKALGTIPPDTSLLERE